MKLQSKVLMIIGSIWVVICFIIYFESKATLESNYQTLEKKLVEQDIMRVQNVIANKFDTLVLYTRPFSQWDDAYQFMRDKNKHFIDTNFVPGTFTSSQINFMMYYEQWGNLFYGKAYDFQNNALIPIPENLFNYLKNNPSFIIHKTVTSTHTGFISLPDGNIAISSLPILTSDGSGPPNGTTLIGYYLNDNYFNEITRLVKMTVQFIPLMEAQTTSDRFIIDAYKALHKNNEFYITNKDAKIAYGFAPLKDLDQKTFGLLKISIPRIFYQESMGMINRYLLATVLIGVVISIILWFLLKYIVLNRVLSVSAQVTNIFSENKFNKRLHIKGNDEIQSMVNSINSLLELISLTQEQLKYRISLRTAELEKLSSLNKNIFKEMSEQRSVEAKLREDEKTLKRLAYYDSLTGLPNRTFFNELLKQAMSGAEKSKSKIAILLIDVNKFKKINDTYGHPFGDSLLKNIAGRLRQAINSADIIAHFSGDEFVLFLTNMNDLQCVDDMVKKIMETLEHPFIIDSITINCTFSIGISIYPNDSLHLEELYKQADLAMYQAKKKEGTTFWYFNIANITQSTLTSE